MELAYSNDKDSVSLSVVYLLYLDVGYSSISLREQWIYREPAHTLSRLAVIWLTLSGLVRTHYRGK